MNAKLNSLRLCLLCVILSGMMTRPSVGAEVSAEALVRIIAPFSSDSDLAIAHLDLTRLNTEQLIKSTLAIKQQLDGVPTSEPGSRPEQVITKLDQLLRDVGCDHVFVVTGWEEARTNRWNLIVHLREGSDVSRAALLLSTFFATGPVGAKTTSGTGSQQGIELVQPIDQAIFCGTRERFERRATNSARADANVLNQLVQSDASSVIQLIVLPGHWRRVLRELNPPLPPQFGTTAGELADAVQHIQIGVTQQGDQHGVGYTVQASSEAGAQRLAAAWQVAHALALTSAGPANLGDLLQRISPRQEGSRLTASVPDVASALSTVKLQELPAHKAARRAVSMNNLKQLALAMHNFNDTWNSFPPAASYDDQGKPLLSWRVYLLPFLAEEALYKQFHLDEPWDSPHNQTLIEKMPATFLSRGLDDSRQGKTCYLVPVGPKTIFSGAVGTPYHAITDGTSKTILMVEVAPQHAVTWTKPDDWPVTPDAILDWLARPNHEPFLMARSDGSVQAVGPETSAEQISAMSTINGGERVSD